MNIAEVELLDRTRPRSPVGAATSWPCPGCGNRQQLSSSWHAYVRNRVGPPLDRWIRLCESCIDTATCAEASARPVSTELSEPWLVDLAESTAILRAVSSLAQS